MGCNREFKACYLRCPRLFQECSRLTIELSFTWQPNPTSLFKSLVCLFSVNAPNHNTTTTKAGGSQGGLCRKGCDRQQQNNLGSRGDKWEMAKLAMSIHFYLNGQSDSRHFKTANQGRINSNSQPEKGFNSKGAKIARFGADFHSRKSAFAGYEPVPQSKRPTYLPAL